MKQIMSILVFVSGNLFSQFNGALDVKHTIVKYDGETFERTGRATVTLKRDNFNTNWKGIHTHFSLNRGIPQQSFGNFK